MVIPLALVNFDGFIIFLEHVGLVDNESSDDGHVTQKLRSFVARSSSKYKSVHLTAVLLDATFHDAIHASGV